MNQFVTRINFNRNLGIHGLLGKFLKNNSGNVLGASFWWLPIRIKDTVFGCKVTDLEKLRTNVEPTYKFVGRQIYKGKLSSISF